MNNDTVSIFRKAKGGQGGLGAGWYAENPLVIELQQLARYLNDTPPGWEMGGSNDYLLKTGNFGRAVDHLPRFTDPFDSRVHSILASYVDWILVNSLSSPEDYVFSPERKIIHFIKSCTESCLWWHMRMLMETTMLLYALGPFTHRDDPWEYLTEEHEDYRNKIGNFGVKAYKLWMELYKQTDKMESVRLATKYFLPLGNAFRDFAWKNYL